MRPAENIEKLITNLSDKTSAKMDEQVRKNMLLALAETEKPLALTRPKIWRMIMKSSITKLAVAAMLVIAILIVTNQFESPTTGVAWGEVVRNMEAGPGFIYRLRQTHIHKDTEKENEFDWKVYGSTKYGYRMEDYLNPESSVQIYSSLKDETLISVVHSSKSYSRIPLTQDQMAQIEQFDPKEAIKEFLSDGYKRIGRKTINGIDAEGVEITNSSAIKGNFQIDSNITQLWIAVETNLPILVESKTIGNNGTLEVHTIQDEFQWNVDLDASEFKPNIPDDYTLQEN